MAQNENRRWKQNLRKAPSILLAKIADRMGQPFRVGCVRKIPFSSVMAGDFAHLGFSVANDQLNVPPEVYPLSKMGKYSWRNAEGHVIIRKDLPKVAKSIYMGERPIYGDWGNGSFDLWAKRMVYQQEQVPASKLKFKIRLLDIEDVVERKFILLIEVDRDLRAGAPGFDADLLFDLNLLQENIGAVDIIATDASDDELLGKIYVNWELLPPGERDATLAEIFRTANAHSEEIKSRVQERYEMLAAYSPEQWIVGTGGFNRYFGAMFPDFVFLENVEYGNAIYRFERSKWQELSKLSRTELLRNHQGEFGRIVHRAGWEDILRKELGSQS
jgi:hypothetical protein